jgi:hypothetical protein
MILDRTDAPTATQPREADAPQPGAGRTGERRAFVVARRRVPVRVMSALVALAALLLVNVGLQLNRRPLDVLSDGFWAYRRVQTCESLGRAPDVLFLGSSRALYSADAHQVDATMAAEFGQRTLSCNLGRMGANFENDYYAFKRVVEDGYAPKMLVENLWENNINANMQAPLDRQDTNVMQVERLADAGDVATVSQHFGQRPGGMLQAVSFLAGKVLPLYGDRVGVYKLACGQAHVGPCGLDTNEWDPNTVAIYKAADDRGWTGMWSYSLANVPPDELATNYLQLYSTIYPGTRNLRIGGQQPEYLAKLIALARAHHVKVALVVSPVHPIYFKFFDRPTDWPAITAYWQSFAATHGVPLYDESQAPGYTLGDFQDPHHLTAAGAIKFSTWMAEHIVAPTL